MIRHALGRPPREPDFQVRSLYNHVRHPLYVGFIVAFWSTPTSAAVPMLVPRLGRS